MHFYTVVVRCVNDKGLKPADCKPDQLDAVGMLFQHPTKPGMSQQISLTFKLGQVAKIYPEFKKIWGERMHIS